jgi:hypothetical protein
VEEPLSVQMTFHPCARNTNSTVHDIREAYDDDQPIPSKASKGTLRMEEQLVIQFVVATEHPEVCKM